MGQQYSFNVVISNKSLFSISGITVRDWYTLTIGDGNDVFVNF